MVLNETQQSWSNDIERNYYFVNITFFGGLEYK